MEERGGKKGSLPKICYSYPIMMKLGSYTLSKEGPKYMNHVAYPLSSADISIFSLETSKIRYIKKYRYRLHFDTNFLILLTFVESLKIFLIKTWL